MIKIKLKQLTHHEESAALAAVANAKSNNLGCAVVTTGPGIQMQSLDYLLPGKTLLYNFH